VLGDIVEDGHRAGQIVASIRSIFTRAPLSREPIDLDAIVRDVVVVLKRELDVHGIALRTELGAPPHAVLGNRAQIHQVVLNLASNAIDAMAGHAAPARLLRISTASGEGGGVLLHVADTGPGVPPSVADRIYDAFFTTRANGTGMGLAICRAMVVAHGGRLWHTSADASGATFHLHLPALPPGAARGRGEGWSPPAH
jgi:signal transduction histidine kinase